MEFLALPEWKITGITETDTGLLIRADLLTGPSHCRHCKTSPALLRSYGVTTMPVKDIHLRRRPVEILLDRRRYLCSVCKGTTLQPVAGVAEGHRMTDRLITVVAQRALRTPTGMVAAEFGLSESLVRAIRSEQVERLERLVSCDAPRVLSVRFAYLAKRERILLTDSETRHVISITAGVGRFSAEHALSKLRDPGRVEIVTLPMSRPIWGAVRQALPRAKVSVDRFNVMGLGNHALDAVRKRVRRRSPRRKDREVVLAAAWILRARFIDIFRTDSSLVARRRHAEWAAGVPKELSFAFGPLALTVEDWSEEIFRYFDHHFARPESEAAGLARRRERPADLRKSRARAAGVIVAG
jgi:transposase